MYVLVYFGVLHDDESVQLAHENRIVPLPDVWCCSDSDSNSDTHADAHSNSDGNTNTDSNTDANSNTNADSAAWDGAKCAEQSQWRSGDSKLYSLDVDGQLK